LLASYQHVANIIMLSPKAYLLACSITRRQIKNTNILKRT